MPRNGAVRKRSGTVRLRTTGSQAATRVTILLVKNPEEQATWIDEIIKKAEEEGEFEDLPGTGKPIPGAGKKDDDLWWVRSWIKRNRKSDE